MERHAPSSPTEAFLKAYAIVRELEGGWVDDPDDPGGATNHGVTQAAYDSYRISKGLPRRSVAEIEEQEVIEIYHDYWRCIRGDDLPRRTGVVVYDAAINHGHVTASKMLQRVVGANPDGVVGPKTIGKAWGMLDQNVMEGVLWERVGLYRAISADARIKFLRGWLGRLIRLRKAVL